VIVGGLVDGFSLSARTAGFVSAAEMAAFAAAALACAAFVRTLSPRYLVTAGVLLFVCGNLLAAFGVTIETVVAARMIAGAGAGVAIATGAALAAHTEKPEVTYAIVLAAVLIFAGIFLTLIPPLVATYGIPVAFLTLAVVGGVTAAFSFALPTAPGGRDEGVAQDVKNPAVSRRAFPVLAACFLLYAGHGAFWTYQERMGVAIGMTPSEIGSALGLASLAGLIGALAAAGLGTRVGRTIPQVIALIMSIFAALLLVHGNAGEMYLIAAVLIAFFWFFGVPYLTGLAAAMDTSGGLAAMAIALLNIGQAVGPFIAAMIVEVGGFVSVGWLAAIFYALCLFMVLPVARRIDVSPAKSQVKATAQP